MLFFSVPALIAGMVDEILRLSPGHNQDNEPLSAQDELFLVLPHTLIGIWGSEKASIKRRLKPRLQKHSWAAAQIRSIEMQHKELLAGYHAKQPLRNGIDQCASLKTNFNACWSCTLGRWRLLQEIICTVAALFPNTAIVESDFSIVGQEKNSSRQYLTDFSIERILRVNQYHCIRSLIY